MQDYDQFKKNVQIGKIKGSLIKNAKLEDLDLTINYRRAHQKFADVKALKNLDLNKCLCAQLDISKIRPLVDYQICPKTKERLLTSCLINHCCSTSKKKNDCFELRQTIEGVNSED